MSLVLCPACRRKGFAWAKFDEGPLTQWDCAYCGLHAIEDERKEPAAPHTRSRDGG